MHKFHSVSKVILGLAAAALLQVGSAQAGDQDFELHNKTGIEIHNVFISPHSTNEWEEDVLGQDTLPSGESVEIKFSPKEEAELWDLKVTDSEGDAVIWENLKLTEITDVILKLKDGEAYAETKNGDE